ncbi:hypothetical protein F4679DRAFT_350565 [Xylaria curta]|nr:hypothetical protein F4679DRAFT_350565 [Xylaria curta]
MAYADEIASSAGRRGQTTIPSSETNSKRRAATRSTPSETGSKLTVPPVLKGAKVTDSDFDKSVMIPYGITLNQETWTTSFYNHFSLPKELSEGRPERLDAYKKELPLDVWLEYDASYIQRICRQYKMMKDDGRCEAEFQAYALATIFRNEDAIPNDFPTASKFVPERRVGTCSCSIGQEQDATMGGTPNSMSIG